MAFAICLKTQKDKGIAERERSAMKRACAGSDERAEALKNQSNNRNRSNFPKSIQKFHDFTNSISNEFMNENVLNPLFLYFESC